MKQMLCLVVATSLLAVSCGGGSGTTTSTPATSKRKVIGVTLLTQTDAFYKALEAGIRQ